VPLLFIILNACVACAVNNPILDLVGGGRIMLDEFPRGGNWFNVGASMKFGGGTFSATRTVRHVFTIWATVALPLTS